MAGFKSVTVAVDFGGTNIKLGLVSDGKVIKKVSMKAYSGHGIKFQLGKVEDEIKQLLKDQSHKLEDCMGLGIAIPGLVNFKDKKVMSINEKYIDAVEFNFVEWAKEAFNLPIVLDNDANLALLGEVYSGCAKGTKDAVLMTLGTGVGTAAVINGSILRGKHYQAGCLGGHFITNVKGRVCSCGSIGCVEAHSGSWAIPGIVREQEDFENSLLSGMEVIDFKSIVECMEKGDKLSIRMFKYLIDNWSAGIVNLVHAYDPEVVVLSGGILKAKDKVLAPIKDNVYKLAWTPWGKVDFAVAEDPDASVLLGLEYLLKEANNETTKL
jgi:glucokinase